MSLCATTHWSLCAWSLCSTREANTMRSPCLATKSCPCTLHIATRESSLAATKSQHNQKQIFLKLITSRTKKITTWMRKDNQLIPIKMNSMLRITWYGFKSSCHKNASIANYKSSCNKRKNTNFQQEKKLQKITNENSTTAKTKIKILPDGLNIREEKTG